MEYNIEWHHCSNNFKSYVCSLVTKMYGVGRKNSIETLLGNRQGEHILPKEKSGIE